MQANQCVKPTIGSTKSTMSVLASQSFMVPLLFECVSASFNLLASLLGGMLSVRFKVVLHSIRPLRPESLNN